MGKYFTLALLLLLVAPVGAQRSLAVDNRIKVRSCRDMLRSAPPLPHVLAAVRMCERSDVQTAQQIARIYGRPMPADQVLDLPASGTTFAAELGYACIGGLAMRRLKNGWEQVRDAQYRYARCRVVN